MTSIRLFVMREPFPYFLKQYQHSNYKNALSKLLLFYIYFIYMWVYLNTWNLNFIFNTMIINKVGSHMCLNTKKAILLFVKSGKESLRDCLLSKKQESGVLMELMTASKAVLLFWARESVAALAGAVSCIILFLFCFIYRT